MKNLLFSPLILIFSLTSFSQTGGVMEKGKFRLGVYYSYDNNLSSDRISFDEYIGYNADYDQYNYTTGFNLDHSITSKLILVSGINYSDRSFTGTYYCDVCDFLTPPQPEKIELQFIEIPITAKYYFIRSIFDVFGEGGIGSLWRIRRINGENDFEGKNHLLSAKIGGGIEYPFLDKYSFQLSVDYTQNLNQVFQDADYAYKVLGIKLGLAMDL